jgi:sugar phosphate isomerase/epimerase
MTNRRIAISEITTAEWSFERDVESYADTEGVDGVGVWRDKLAAFDGSVADASALIDEGGLETCSLVFAGGFTDLDEFDGRVADAKRAVEDAATLGAPVLMVLAGPRLGIDAPEGDDLVRNAIEAIAPAARDADIGLALEPLHPVDITRFSTVVTMAQALDIVEDIDGAGLMYDTWNTWWDPEVFEGIERAGEDIAAVQVADWRHPSDQPRDRAIPGRGEAPLADLLARVEAAGYEGWYEIELFTERYAPEEYPVLLKECVAGVRAVFDEMP